MAGMLLLLLLLAVASPVRAVRPHSEETPRNHQAVLLSGCG